MKKTILTLLVVLGLWSNCLCQISSDYNAECLKVFLMYQFGDSSQIAENWKHQETEPIKINDFRRIQYDAYGKLTNPHRFNYQHSYSHTYKYAELDVRFDSVFISDLESSLFIDLYKGKKKKSKYLIEDIQIISKSESSSQFMDSLCLPYLNLIENKQTDSVLTISLPKDKLNDLIAESNKIKSKKKRKKALMVIGFMYMGNEMLKEALQSIDHNAGYQYLSNKLKLESTIPTLTAYYGFKNVDGEDIQINLSFQIQTNQYVLTSIGFSKMMNAPNN